MVSRHSELQLWQRLVTKCSLWKTSVFNIGLCIIQRNAQHAGGRTAVGRKYFWNARLSTIGLLCPVMDNHGFMFGTKQVLLYLKNVFSTKVASRRGWLTMIQLLRRRE